MANQIGIWMDQREAFLIRFNRNGEPIVDTIQSNIEDFHVVGGARSKTPWGPMDNVSESKYLERNKHQQQEYYKSITKLIPAKTDLYLFGPAQTKNKFKTFIDGKPNLNLSNCKIETADKMTIPQKVAQVKKYFKNKIIKF